MHSLDVALPLVSRPICWSDGYRRSNCERRKVRIVGCEGHNLIESHFLSVFLFQSSITIESFIMPVYQGIKISVISQYGAQALPEYSPSRIFDHSTLAPAPNDLPALLDSTTRTATVYVPIFPNSVFWFRYHVWAPVANLFYFKAYMNGQHLVSWGTGEADNFKGKVMFGLFRSSRSELLPERVLLAFSNDISLDGHASIPPGRESLEIRVYRSRGRRLKDETAPPFRDRFSPDALGTNDGRFRDALA